MTANTIELSIEAARSVIPCLQQQIAALDEDIEKLTAERGEKQKTLSELQTRLDGKEASKSQNGSVRLRKGTAEKLIIGALSSLPENEKGITIQDLIDRTGIPYATAFRILKTNKKGLFDNPEGLWQIRKQK